MDPADESPVPADHAAILDRVRAKVRQFPTSPGVYLMKDAKGVVLYVGKAINLDRVSSYFQAADLDPRKQQMVSQVVDVDFLDRETEATALLTEARLIKDIQPRYNARLTDDKTFPYLEITIREDFPGVYITRTPAAKGTRLYGPFTNGLALRESLSHLQKVFKFRTCHLEIHEGDDKRRFFRPCLLYPIKQCTAPCAAHISKEAYREDIKRFQRFLESKRSDVLRQLTKEMADAAAAKEYERAARLRDEIKALQGLAARGRPDENVQPELFYQDPKGGLEALGKLLSLPELPRTIEGIDIATLGGGESVGSAVYFLDGVPFKNNYRRFRIKTVAGVDDFAMVREVVSRHYKPAGEGHELFPDIILIDGGIGQLNAALEGARPNGPQAQRGVFPGQTRRGNLHPRPPRPDQAPPQQRSLAFAPTSPRRSPPLRPTLPPHFAKKSSLRRRSSPRPQTGESPVEEESRFLILWPERG